MRTVILLGPTTGALLLMLKMLMPATANALLIELVGARRLLSVCRARLANVMVSLCRFRALVLPTRGMIRLCGSLMVTLRPRRLRMVTCGLLLSYWEPTTGILRMVRVMVVEIIARGASCILG